MEAVPGAQAEMVARSGRSSVPQIFIGEVHVGGCDELQTLDAAGRLDSLLKSRELPDHGERNARRTAGWRGQPMRAWCSRCRTCT